MVMELEARKLDTEREERRLVAQAEERRQQELQAEEQQRLQEMEAEERRSAWNIKLSLIHRRLIIIACRRQPFVLTLLLNSSESCMNTISSPFSSFEKIAQLNAFPEDKYAAILQAHLTGKALKVFAELSVEDCQDYRTVKAALLTAYAVVTEVYRKRFRTLNKHHSETFSEFAFRLSVQFRC